MSDDNSFFIDFSSVKGDEFSVIGEGEYDATVKKAAIKRPDDPNGATYINLEMRIDEGQQFAGATLFTRIFLDARKDKENYQERALRTLNRAKFVLKTMGVDFGDGKTKFSQTPDGTLIEPNLVGKPVHVWVNHREYPEGSGQKQPNVTRIHGKTNPPKAGANGATQNSEAATVAEGRYL